MNTETLYTFRQRPQPQQQQLTDKQELAGRFAPSSRQNDFECSSPMPKRQQQQQQQQQQHRLKSDKRISEPIDGSMAAAAAAAATTATAAAAVSASGNVTHWVVGRRLFENEIEMKTEGNVWPNGSCQIRDEIHSSSSSSRRQLHEHHRSSRLLKQSGMDAGQDQFDPSYTLMNWRADHAVSLIDQDSDRKFDHIFRGSAEPFMIKCGNAMDAELYSFEDYLVPMCALDGHADDGRADYFPTDFQTVRYTNYHSFESIPRLDSVSSDDGLRLACNSRLRLSSASSTDRLDRPFQEFESIESETSPDVQPIYLQSSLDHNAVMPSQLSLDQKLAFFFQNYFAYDRRRRSSSSLEASQFVNTPSPVLHSKYGDTSNNSNDVLLDLTAAPLYYTTPPLTQITKRTTNGKKKMKKNRCNPEMKSEGVGSEAPETHESPAGSCANCQGSAEICGIESPPFNMRSSQSLPSQLNKDACDRLISCKTKSLPDWREVECVPVRTEGKRQQLENLFQNVKNGKTSNQLSDESPVLSKKVKKTIKNLFGHSPKFQKTTKSGVYLASIFHHEGRILVTSDDFIPMMEVESEHVPSMASLKADFHWLNKLSCCWSSVKILKRKFEKSSYLTDSLQFKNSLLQAVTQLQRVTGMQDLGSLHHKIISDGRTSAHVIVTLKSVKSDIKSVNTAHLRWISIDKFQRSKTASAAEKDEERCDEPSLSAPVSSTLKCNQYPSTSQPPLDVVQSITTDINDMLSYSSSSATHLPKGLYLGYLKLTCAREHINVVVPIDQPNVLPHVKIRDDQNVSREEWRTIYELSEPDCPGRRRHHQSPSFKTQLADSCHQLFNNLGLGGLESSDHRLYRMEVFEFSHDVSFILVIPSVDKVCIAPGQREDIPPTCMTLPLQQFEMNHMRSYHSDLIRRYSQISTLLEVDFYITQHQSRQEISIGDAHPLQVRVAAISGLQQQLEESWKSMRWIMDVISNARDKKSECAIPLGALLDNFRSPVDQSNATVA